MLQIFYLQILGTAIPFFFLFLVSFNRVLVSFPRVHNLRPNLQDIFFCLVNCLFNLPIISRSGEGPPGVALADIIKKQV